MPRSPPSKTTPAPLSVRVHESVAEVPQAAWNALGGPSARPFLDWRYLHALEASGSAAPRRGWSARHLTAWRAGRLVAAAPAYLKAHSMGEFFYNDFRWAEVAAHFGTRYYPKLVLVAPFSPATFPRALVAEGEDEQAVLRLLVRAAVEHAKEEGLGSVHALFVRDADLAAFTAEGFAPGAGLQYHWTNHGYGSFDDFLARFNSKRRHMLRAERAQLAKDGTRVRTVSGDALDEDLLAFAGRCYEATVDRHAWHAAHLTRGFFRRAATDLRDLVEVVVAEEGGRRLGAALNLRGAKRLFGRQWGAVEDRRFLHFNVCYYHSIERCIADGLEAFEPGAGGEHKLVRGFEPTLVRSAHWFSDPRLHAAMAAHLGREVASYEAHVGEAREAGVAFRAGRGGSGQD